MSPVIFRSKNVRSTGPMSKAEFLQQEPVTVELTFYPALFGNRKVGWTTRSEEYPRGYPIPEIQIEGLRSRKGDPLEVLCSAFVVVPTSRGWSEAGLEDYLEEIQQDSNEDESDE